MSRINVYLLMKTFHLGSMFTLSGQYLFLHRVLGLHVNFIASSYKPMNLVRWLVGAVIPQVAPGRALGNYEKMYPISKVVGGMLAESGYMHIHATKPDTVGK